MNFRPEKLYLGKNPDGSNLRIEEWNYDTRAGYELAGSFMNLFVGVLFVQIISPFLLILCILNFSGRANILNVIGILLGSYFLYDASHGWLVTNFLHILLSERIINILVYLNTISVVLHTILFLFSTFIFNVINKKFNTKDDCNQAFLCIILILTFFIFVLTENTLDSNKGWVNKNIDAYIERNEVPEPVKVEDSKPTYDDGMFHPDDDFLDDFDHGKTK